MYLRVQVFEAGPRLKLYSASHSRQTSRYPWKWPYLDIHFYQQNNSHIWDSAPEYGSDYSYPKAFVFPLHLRPLGGLWLNAPYDSYVNIVATYGKNVKQCQSKEYNHQ